MKFLSRISGQGGFRVVLAVLILFSLSDWTVLAQESTPVAQPTPTVQAPVAPNVTTHSITLDGRVLDYVATAGFEELRGDDGQLRARMFYVAYTLPGISARIGRLRSFSMGDRDRLQSGCIWVRSGPSAFVSRTRAYRPARPCS